MSTYRMVISTNVAMLRDHRGTPLVFANNSRQSGIALSIGNRHETLHFLLDEADVRALKDMFEEWLAIEVISENAREPMTPGELHSARQIPAEHSCGTACLRCRAEREGLL